MTTTHFLHPKILAKLQTIYDDLPEQSKQPEGKPQTDSLKEFLKVSGSSMEVQEGEILFRQNELGDGIYLIEAGVLAVVQGSLAEPRLLAFRHPGQIVGEMALLESIKRTASVAAMNPSRLKYLSNEEFQSLLERIPGFGMELIRVLSSRLREIKPADFSDGLYDHLTGVLSRQAFDIRLQEEIDRAQVYQYDLSLVFLDLDHFKEINDTYGHARGDEVLIAFVKRVKANLRMTDLFFRFGGDEFVLLLPGVDQSLGPTLVQHILDDVNAMEIPGESPLKVTFSAGVSYYPDEGQTAEMLLEAADQRVYQAKRMGRGRVAGSP